MRKFLFLFVILLFGCDLKDNEIGMFDDSNYTLEVYIDHASLPTLHQLMDILDSADKNSNTERLVAWSRIELSKKVKKQLDITSFELEKNHTTLDLIDAIIARAETYKHVNIKLSTNTGHSYSNLMPILKALHKFDNVTITGIDLYDDGSLEYVNLYKWKDELDKNYQLTSGADELTQVISGVKNSFSGSYISSIYNWQQLYPTKYHFLRKDYLTVESELNGLRDYLGDSLEQMQWDRFKLFNNKQKELFLSIVGFDKNKLQRQYDVSNAPNFIFTGTTTWAGKNEKKFFAEQQINVIDNALNDTSPYYFGEQYNLFFKGHPRGSKINEMILEHFHNMTNIPAKVSFEILMMTDMLPDAIAGMASSLYFTIPSEKIKFIVFTSSGSINNRQEAINSPLVQVMIKLNIVNEHNIIFWSDLPDCHTGVCISK